MQEIERKTRPLGQPVASPSGAESRFEEGDWRLLPESLPSGAPSTFDPLWGGVAPRLTRKIDLTDGHCVTHGAPRRERTIGLQGLDRRYQETPAPLPPATARDIDGAAIVIAMTAFFGTFLFGVVTQIPSGQLPQLALSVACAISSGLIARGWMVTRLRSRSTEPPA
jgi:hypothetical protein